MDDDKGGGDEDVEADGWEEGAGDQDMLSAMVWIVFLWRVANGV